MNEVKNRPDVSPESIETVGEASVASTRGDGETGEDVTPNVETIKEVPLVSLSHEAVAALDRLLDGLTFVFTGSLDLWTRDEAKQRGVAVMDGEEFVTFVETQGGS